MSNKERINNIKTTAMGAIVFTVGTVLLCLGKMDAWAYIPVCLLSYMLIMAKDSILEGITLGLFKNKDNGTAG